MWTGIYKWLSDALHRLTLNALSKGPIPQHVAFVMDGNRRYARTHRKQIREGHLDGFEALKKVAEMCFRLDIHCVTVYAFSIENFKRSPEEVSTLMDLAHDRLLELCQHGELLNKYDVRLNVIGRKELLPPKVAQAVAKAEELTTNNSSFVFNVCLPYTSRDEMARAAERNLTAVVAGDAHVANVSMSSIEEQLDTTLLGLPPVDILIRSSGVHRFSDFFLWQISESTEVNFVPTYWPKFGLLDMVPVILDYQRHQWKS